MKEKKAREAHHELGPSALKYVEICPGYRSENVSSPWAEEGTMLHEACETGELKGLDDEQTSAVAHCLNYVEALEKDADEAHKELMVEIHLDGFTLDDVARGRPVFEGSAE